MGFNLHSMSLSRGIILHRLPLASAKPSITSARSTTRPQVVVAAHVPSPREVDSRRRSANYKPTTWDYEFLQSFEINDIDDFQDELYKDRVVMLEKELKALLARENMEEMLELIDDIQRLGLSHRFENEIQNALKRFLHTGGCHNITNKSIYHVALGFRLLRQNGYHVSQDVFKEFVNEKGVFNGDVKDMLSLYEASYLAYEGEDILHKANAQTTSYLNNFMSQTNFNDDLTIKKLVRHSLEVPLHRRMEMLEARWYIETYKESKGANHALTKLATLDFNMAQSVLQADLKDVSRWWSSLGLAKEMSFSRDRLVECFFWTIGMMFEPRFSSCRKGLTKVTSFITTIDDIYDVYGTLEELKLFTDAVERWDINAVHTLPSYMKPCFSAFYNTVNDIANETLHTHESSISPHLVKAWADMLKAFLKEAEWSYDKSGAAPPTFSEYIENGWRSVSGTVILVHAYCFLNGDDDGHVFSKEMLEDHLLSYDEIVRWPSVIFRLCNDLATSSGEIARGETVNAISCYMNENGVSEEEARKHLKSMIDQAWKNMNQEMLEDHLLSYDEIFAKSFVRSVFNLARIAHYTYQRGDSHGNPDAGSKKTIFSLIFEPIINDSKFESLI
ncbi:Probable terpene synthase 12 [Linum perenne]